MSNLDGRILDEFTEGINAPVGPEDAGKLAVVDEAGRNFRYATAESVLSGIPGLVGPTGPTGPFGGAVAIPYGFVAGTSDVSPGPGGYSLDDADLSAATVLRVSVTGADGRNYQSVLETFDDSTSTVKGLLRLVSADDPTLRAVFRVNGLTVGAGGGTTYLNLAVTHLTSSPGLTVANAVVCFDRTGDRGEQGEEGPVGPTGATGALDDGTVEGAPLTWQGSSWQQGLFVRILLARGPDGSAIEVRGSDSGGNATASMTANGDGGIIGLLAAGSVFIQSGGGRYDQQPGDEFTPAHRFQTEASGTVENLAMGAAPGPAPTIGFLGAAPVARPELDGASTQAHVDALVSALATLGLVTDGRTGPGGVGPTELHTIRLIASYRA